MPESSSTLAHAPGDLPAAAPRGQRLNLAALTAEELQRLLGESAAQRRMPEMSQARLEGRAVPGDLVPREQEYQLQPEKSWGATPELARQLITLRSELTQAGACDLGVYYQPLLSEGRHLRAFLLAPDTALALRWSETPESRSSAPSLLAATLMRDRASGTAAVLSSTSVLPFVPTQSEEIDARLYQGASTQALLDAHRTQVLRHGRGVRLGQVAGHEQADWLKVFTAVRQLNLAAWTRRGLLVQDAP